MGKGLKQKFLQRRHKEGHQVYEKTLSRSLITKRKANQNHNEIFTSHPLGWPLSKGQNITNIGEDVASNWNTYALLLGM